MVTTVSKHSKWAKIKRQKATTDARRGVRFGKLARAITAAAREGGTSPETNVHLRVAIEQAAGENMPKENIQRAIDRATGGTGGAALTSLSLEGRGPGGVALLIDAVTENRRRTVGDIRHILAEGGGALSGSGSARWMFERRGRIRVEGVADTDAVELAAMDAGARETTAGDGVVEILTTPQTLHAVTSSLSARGTRPARTELTLVPKHTVALPREERERLERLVEALEEHDDVIHVATNARRPPSAPSGASESSR